MPRATRQHRLLSTFAAMAAGCALALVLALAGGSIAVAWPGHGGDGRQQGGGGGSQGHERGGGWHDRGRGKEAAETPAPVPAPVPVPGVSHGHGHDGGAPESAGASSSQSSAPAAIPGKGRQSSSRSRGGRSDGSPSGQAARPARANALAPATSAPAATPAPAAPAVVTPAATAPISTPTTAPSVASTPPANSSSAQRASGGHRASRGRHTRARRHGASPSGPATLAAAPATIALAAATPASAAGRVGPARNPHRASNTKPAAAQPPIVQTITKIVGVIPLAVWIAGGALAFLALALAFGSRLLANRARRLERQRGELLADVGVLQTALLPAPPLGPGPVAATVAFKPADGPAAGGDFYDVFALRDGTIAAIVGDVSGHGRAALPHTALVRFTLRAYLEAGLSPREALRTAGAVIDRQLDGEMATAVLATYHPRDRSLVYASAGHPPPIVLGERPLQPLVTSAAPPIGAGMTTGTRQTVVSLPGAARVCLHTDGVTDARTGGELYGGERLSSDLAALGPDATAAQLLDRVGERTDSRPDDMAACLLSLSGGQAQPVTLVQELELFDGDGARERAERFLIACGLNLTESARVASEACERAERTGSALIEARPSGPGAGTPRARVRREDVPDIHASDARRLATVGGAR